MAKKPKVRNQQRWVATITFWTFVLSLLMSLGSQAIFFSINSIILALIVLLFIIFIGIIFDMIGIAAAAAEEAPLGQSRQKHPEPGKLYILCAMPTVSPIFVMMSLAICRCRQWDTGSIISDKPGDKRFFRDNTVISIVVTGLISALTVGGKALGKTYAIEKSTEIVLGFAYVLLKIEALCRKIFSGKPFLPGESEVTACTNGCR